MTATGARGAYDIYTLCLTIRHKSRLAFPLDITELLLEGPESMQGHTRQTAAGRTGIIYFVRRKFCLLLCDVQFLS